MTPRSPDFKRNASLIDLISDTSTKKPRLAPETGWYRVAISELFEGAGVGGQYLGSTDAVFRNSWANAGGTQVPPASFYLSHNGEVRFRGKITGGIAASIMTVLPPELRPEYAETFIVATDGGGNATLTIRPNGEVYVETIN